MTGALADVGDVKVGRIMCSLRLEKEKDSESWKQLHMGGIDDSSWQRLQMMMTQLLQKHRELQEGRRPMMRHGNVIRPTMYLASMDIKTSFVVARPKHIENYGRS